MPRAPQSGHLVQRQPQEPLRAGYPDGPALLNTQPRASWGLCAGCEPRSPDSGHRFNVFNAGHLKTPLSIRPSWESPGRVSYVLSRCVLTRGHTGICERALCPPLPGSSRPQTTQRLPASFGEEPKFFSPESSVRRKGGVRLHPHCPRPQLLTVASERQKNGANATEKSVCFISLGFILLLRRARGARLPCGAVALSMLSTWRAGVRDEDGAGAAGSVRAPRSNPPAFPLLCRGSVTLPGPRLGGGLTITPCSCTQPPRIGPWGPRGERAPFPAPAHQWGQGIRCPSAYGRIQAVRSPPRPRRAE